MRSTTSPHTTPTNPPSFLSPGCQRCTWTYINVTLTDVNDNAPRLFCPASSVMVNESVTIGSPLFSCSATDADQGMNAAVTFRFADDVPEFAIDRFTGRVTLAWDLDVLRSHNYTLVVVAEDRGSPALQTTSTVTVSVTDVNNHAPVFTQAVYNFNVVENSAAGLVVGQINAADLDEGMNGQFTYSVVNGSLEATTILSVHVQSGVVTLVQSPDREHLGMYTLTVRCRDKGLPALSTETLIVVTIFDVNDNQPIFSAPLYTAAILENQDQMMLITHVQAADMDFGLNGTAGIVFSLTSQSDARFAIDPSGGDILATQPIIYNEDQLIVLEVVAADRLGGVGAKTTKVNVEVTILPRNLHTPIFQARSYGATIDEFVIVGSPIGVTVLALDGDLGGGFGDVTYLLHDLTGNFAINARSGVIVTNASLDWNRQAKYVLPVIARDMDDRFDLVYVTINITYNLLHPAPLFEQPIYVADVSENRPIGFLLPVLPHAVDAVNGLEFPFRYFISQADTAWFAVDSARGSITVAGLVDREAIFNGRTVSMTITALYVPNGRTATCTVVVNVLDLNDNAPVFSQASYAFSQLENIAVGDMVGVVAASDADFAINQVFAFSIVPRARPFAVDPTSGEVYLTAALDRETQDNFVFVVRVMDAGGLFSDVNVTVLVLDVNDNAPVLNSILAPFGALMMDRTTNGVISSITLTSFSETNCLVLPCSDSRTVMALSSSDRDLGVNAQIVYELIGASAFVLVDSSTGRVSLKTAVDREAMAQFTFALLIRDAGSPRLSTAVNVSVVLTDLNDNRPVVVPVTATTLLVSEAVGRVPLAVLSAADADITDGNNKVELFARSTSGQFYMTESYLGMVTAPGTPRILSNKPLAYNYATPSSNLYTVNVTARNSLASPVLWSAVQQVSVRVLPFIGNDTVADATKILFDWRAPDVCEGVNDCQLPLVSPWTNTSTVELWTQRSYSCNSALCQSKVINPATPSACECLLYGPTLPTYNASGEQFLLPGQISGTANAFQLRMYDQGALQFATAWFTKTVQSFVPTGVTLTMVNLVSFNISWTAPPQPNGDFLGYRVCYCLVDRVPSSSCTCTGVLGSDATSSPDSGLTGRTSVLLPDPSVASELLYNTSYTVLVELVTLLSDRTQTVARSDAVVFTTSPIASAASTSALPGGSIAGAVIGAIAGLSICVLLACVVVRRRRAKSGRDGRRNGSEASVNAIIESNLNRRQEAKHQGRHGPGVAGLLGGNHIVAESNTEGGFHYYTQERADQFLGTPNADEQRDGSVAVNMGEMEDEPASLTTSFVPLIVHPNYDDDDNTDRAKGRAGYMPGSGGDDGEEEATDAQRQEQQQQQQQKNFGLRVNHVMAGEAMGELIPRTNSRSSPFVSRKRSTDRSIEQAGPADPQDLQFNGHLLSSHAVVINSAMAARLATLKLTGALDEEFAFVKSQTAKFEHLCTAAKEPYNVRKNRYVNVLPPDHSRLALSHNGVLGSDYINASYIDGWQSKHAYIATQGPLATTVQDFWRMMWEENCAVIINTTSLEEAGRPKCHKYWPEPGGTIQCGMLEISSEAAATQLGGYSRRVLGLRNTKSSRERNVVHLSFDAWPDHGVPASPDQVLALIKDARLAQTVAAEQGVAGPLVLHCSAGLGRTGVICAVDICLQRAAAVGNFDVPTTVVHIRKARPGSVQTVEQYGFIYEAVARANANVFSVTRAAAEPLTPSTPAAGAVSITDDTPLSAAEWKQLQALGGDGPRDLGDLLRALDAI